MIKSQNVHNTISVENLKQKITEIKKHEDKLNRISKSHKKTKSFKKF